MSLLSRIAGLGINIALIKYGVIVCTVVICFIAWKILFGKAKVNCWFCNGNSKVGFRLRNKWHCPHCHQYNGFNSSGDYNKPITGMHDESFNVPSVATRPVDGDTTLIDQQVKLCAKCSRNQLLKVKQISQFEPIREDNFAEEAKAYERKLDRLYVLCKQCQDATNRHIKMQDTILRGRMLSKKRLDLHDNISLNTKPQNRNTRQFQNRYLCILIWCLVLFSSFIHTYSIVTSAVGSMFSPYNFWVPKQLVDNAVSGEILNAFTVCGFACSIACLSIQNSVSRINVLCALLWFVHAFLVPLSNGMQIIQNMFQKQATSSSEDAAHSMEEKLSDLTDVTFGKTDTFGRDQLYVLFSGGLSLVALIGLSGASLYQAVNYKSQQNMATRKTNTRSNPRIKQKKKQFSPIKQDGELFSDCSMPSEDDSPPRNMPDQALNGSLNALNLSGSQFLAQTKQTEPQNTLLSALHTPPPSRSSSLLSLSSHHSGQHLPHGNGFNPGLNMLETMMEVDNCNVLPFSRYKANTTVSAFNHRSTTPSFSAKSTASFPAMHWQRKSTLNKVPEHSGSYKPFCRPIISPAKLNWQVLNHRKRTLDNSSSVFNSPASKVSIGNQSFHTAWERKSSLDVSFHDSVSQTGEQYRPELSDDEDQFMCQTPQKLKSSAAEKHNLNSSSPKSVISNLSSVTMRSIEEVENSRLCKWLIVGVLVLNLVLVVLLVLDVKEIRESQSWKANSASL